MEIVRNLNVAGKAVCTCALSFTLLATSCTQEQNKLTPEEIANHDEAKAKNVIRRMTHVNDITPRNFVEVCIDMKQQGVAGYDSWGDRPLPEHTLPANKEYHWGFTLMPIK